MFKYISILILISGCGGEYAQDIIGQPIDPGQYEVTAKKIGGGGSCKFFTEEDKEIWNIRKRDDGYYILLHGVSVKSYDGMNFHGNADLNAVCSMNVTFKAQVEKDRQNSFVGKGQIYVDAGICGGCEDYAKLSGTIVIKK